MGGHSIHRGDGGGLGSNEGCLEPQKDERITALETCL